jgi:adenine-specific DNA-methyltransferase
MRYIGNKTRLLDFIRGTLRARGIRGGTAVDPFTGTASVARALKRGGFNVVAADVMEYAHVFGRAYVQSDGRPALGGVGALLGRRAPTLKGVLAHLEQQPPEPGFLHEHFTPAGAAGAAHGRMYFTPENAARIDGIRGTLEAWRADGVIDEEEFFVLLATLIEAADAVANTAGVYAACIKSWQPNALRPLRLRLPPPARGPASVAYRADAHEVVAGLSDVELLYLDPPYNTRQYPGYYHLPELIARGWFDAPPALRGKTGLLPDAEQRSDWSRRRRCEDALARLVAATGARHIVMSYNSEGIIPETTIERVFREYGRAGTYRCYRRRYRRDRADADGERRTYTADVVEERLYCVSR